MARRRRSQRGPRLRDRFFQRKVAAAIMSPAGIAGGSTVAALALATGAHPLVSIVSGIAGWLVPVARAMRYVDGSGARPTRTVRHDAAAPLTEWDVAVIDAEDAVARFASAIDRCSDGPLRDRLDAMEEDVLESLACCRELAAWGAEAQSARQELDPAAMERAARRAGRAAKDAARSQRELISELVEIEDECRVRLALINGRLDEAVGRAVDLAGRSRRVGRRRRSRGDLDAVGGASELSEELRALRNALHDLDAHDGRRPGTSQTSPG